MATQLTNTKSAATRTAPARTKQVEQYVDRQLKKTTWQLRVSDMIASVIGLFAFVLAFFIVVALIDGWIWSLSITGRVVALSALLGGMGTICWITIVPLSWRRINPQYAAKMIEDGKPGFKNSLVNFLSLKRNKSDVKQAVLTEVTRKAARDLQTITIENSVDRSNVIRMGFILVALATLAIVYSVLSPKNPLQTVRRVLAPVSKISKPAVVRISNVDPGDTDVFFGDRLEVTAEIGGRHEPEDVRLYYSTNDGQIVDASIPMQPGESRNQYVARLSTGPAGIQQPLTYYVVARDGRSPDYNVNVRANPSISINTIRITPPKYTRLPERTIEGHGEIQAPEGSRIEIEATANLPIKVAYIELLQATSDSPQSGDFRVEEVEMQFDGNSATGHFVAMLNSKRTKPKFSHYRVRFRSVDGFRNERPNVYPIQVIADLGPEIEIVKPRDKEIALPVNQPLTVEVRAADLDFEISSVDLQIDHQGTKLLDRNLPMDLNRDGDEQGLNDNQRVTAQMIITPDDLNLEPGDRVIMFAKAADNRVSPNNSLPDPNVSFTDNYTLIITEPIKNPKQPKQDPQANATQQREQQPQQKQNGNRSDQNSQDGGQPQDDLANDQQPGQSDQPPPDEGAEGQSNDGDSNSEGSQSNQESKSNQSGDSSSGNDSGDSQQQGDQQHSGQSGDSAGGETAEQNGQQKQAQSPQQKDGNQNQSQAANNENRVSNASGDGQSSATDAKESGGGSNQSGNQDDSTENQPSSGDSQSGDGQEQDGVSNNRQPSDANSGGQNRDTPADGGEGLRDDSLADGQQEPLRKDAPEGEQFERLKDVLEKQGQKATDQNADDSYGDAEDKQNRRQTDDGDSEQNVRGDDPNESQMQEKQPGNGQSGNEQSKDGNPQQAQPDGGQSQDGQPDQRQSGDGETSAQKQSNSGEGGRDQHPSNPNQPADSKDSGGNQDSQDPNGIQSQDDADRGNNQKNGNSQNEDQPGRNESSDGDSQSGQQNESDDRSQEDSTEQPGTHPTESNGSENQSSGGKKQDATTDPSAQSKSKAGQSGAESGSESSSDSGEQPARSSSNKTQGFGGSGGSTGAEEGNDQSDPVGDKANLDHARKATDLILQKLADQEVDPDPELLEQMNWTKEDLQGFLKRWEEMKNNAKSGDPRAKRQYDNALLSLGLEPKVDGRSVQMKKDKLYRLNQDAAVEQVPAEFVDEFNEFLKSRNRSQRK